MTTSSASLAATPATVKCPTRIITYAWGAKYVDTLLSLTLPALLAPGNLPYVASEVPCELIILTQWRFFFKINRHPAVVRIRKLCPVRLVRLDDLIVSKDKYGMTLTYALHRAFSDLGPAMTEHWQIFLNADFILADGSLRTVIGHLSRGARIVASPSYCTIAEEVIPELRKHLDATTSTLSIPHRELARLILQHRHTVIRGKTVNQTSFHMRYADQFYWSVDDGTLIGYQMPVSIVGLRPKRYVAEPKSYWDFGLIWEYCPRAEISVIGNSDDFMMLELRDRSVAQDQIVPGPLDKKEVAERMVTWVTPYQRHFLNFPLTLHDRDLPPTVEDARVKLRSFVDEVMSNTPPLPSHIKHSQWEYHWAAFQDARRLPNRIRSWGKTRLQHLATAVTPVARVTQRAFRRTVVSPLRAKLRRIELRAELRTIEPRVERKAIEIYKPFARVVGNQYVRPALRWLGLEIVKSTTLSALQKTANLWASEATLKAEEVTRLKGEWAREVALKEEEVSRLKGEWAREAALKEEEVSRLKGEWAREAALKEEEVSRLKGQQQADRISITRFKEKIADLNSVVTKYQLKLGRHDLGYTQRPRFTEWVIQRGLLETAFTLVDVGVQGGIHPRWNALGNALRVYGFDPLEEAIEPLVRFNLPNHQYHAVALGDQDGERDFFVPEVLPASSFFPRETKQDQARMTIDPSNWRAIQTRRVPIRRLDTLMSEGVVPRADFLKIDCEGFEPAVLKGAGRFLGETGVLGIESEIGFSSIDWPQTHFLAVYEQLLPHGFRLSDLAFNRVHFRSFLERARSLGRETTTISFPGTFEILFSRSLTIAKVAPSRDEVLKAAIIFELYGMLDVAYDLLQVFQSIFPPSAQIQDGADELIPKRGCL
jgi:FkbM family methyltransferase